MIYLSKKLRMALIAVLAVVSSNVVAQDVITFVWEAETSEKSFWIRATDEENFTVHWGDGSSNPYMGMGSFDITPKHTYTTEGTYTVTITGNNSSCRFTYLACQYNSLNSLDVSKSTALTILYCFANSLSSLDVSKNTALTRLYCGNNNLTALDLTNLDKLTDFLGADQNVPLTLYNNGNGAYIRLIPLNNPTFDNAPKISYAGGELKSTDITVNNTHFSVKTGNNSFVLEGDMLFTYSEDPYVVHTITATAGNNGSINPSGAVKVEKGENKTFTFSANSGYEIDKVLINDVNNPSAVSARTYTFSNITADHSISVSFKKIGVGIVESGSTRPIQIHPNPTTGQLKITNCELRANTVIEIYDVYGKNLTPLTSHPSPLILDISHLANGMYFLKVEGKVFKVIKE